MHSFIIKLSLEQAPGRTGRIVWHGYITHVPGGERRYLKDLDGLAAFITPYLESSGVKFGVRSRMSRWMRRLKSRALQSSQMSNKGR